MLTKPNFQRLLDVAKATEKMYSDEFNMSAVCERGGCGTVACMIGNYNLMTGRSPFTFSDWTDGRDWEHFGITKAEYDWLFASFADIRNWESKRRNLSRVTKAQSLKRLRLFLYYKMHKHELCYDEKYGVSQESRTREGNHGFATRALAECGA